MFGGGVVLLVPIERKPAEVIAEQIKQLGHRRRALVGEADDQARRHRPAIGIGKDRAFLRTRHGKGAGRESFDDHAERLELAVGAPVERRNAVDQRFAKHA